MELSSINKRILETIEESEFSKEIKDMLKALLNVEMKNSQTKNPIYSKDYDRIIISLAKLNRELEDK